jgi:glutamate-ammonia-ligase adenylyltransferase
VANLRAIARHLGAETLATLWPALLRLLPRCPDPDRALNNLERFFAHPDGRDLAGVLLDSRARPLEILLGLFATSQTFSDLLAQQPRYFEMARIPVRKTPSTAELRDGLRAEVEACGDDAAVLLAFRRFRLRQLLRIGTNDIVRDRSLEEITRDISRVADVAIAVALETALRNISRRFGTPFDAGGTPLTCAVFAFGKLGGEELNYSSDIDIMMLYSEEGQTRGGRGTSLAANEYYDRVVSELVRLLATHSELGTAYRIDLRLRPEGQRGPLTRSLASALAYYDKRGRTWERQALIKLRPVAGDLALGERFVREIEPYVYRKFLSFSEINEIKALKRKIEQKSRQAGVDGREVKTGHGGIRDIEFTIQFLQLLNGGDLPGLRQRNTLAALAALEEAGALTDQEYRVLDDSYRFLRKTEHRLQLLFDLQTHRLPDNEAELGRLALRMGYVTPEGADPEAKRQAAREAFRHDYLGKTAPTRIILDHLLHQTFGGQTETAEPETDLLLDPNPDPETIRAVLGRYPFRDVDAAYANLVALSQEVPFLSARRCRHFLASIAPQLLRAVAETPDPDMALLNLEKVTASLGAKTVLWELFSFNLPTLRLYVDLCAHSQYLSEILINNPGMIDELLDSLVLNQPRDLMELQSELRELSRGATDPEPILHSFQDTHLLRIGVRDILGKQTIQETTAGLSDLAETILIQVARNEYFPTEVRHGAPLLDGGPHSGKPVRVAIVALGKLGAREMNYHSDLDLMVIYEGEGRSYPPEGSRAESTEAGVFYTVFTQRLIRQLNHVGPMGRLYKVDMRLRPDGKSGSLVLPLADFRRYYGLGGGGQLWERQVLTRARVVHAEGDFGLTVQRTIAEATYGRGWQPEMAGEIAAMREKQEQSRPPRDLKRGPGGLSDIEFLLQRLQLEHGVHRPELRQTNTWQALTALRRVGILDVGEYTDLSEGYAFLLRVQNRLRIVHNRAIDLLPEESAEIDKLARRLGIESGQRLSEELETHRQCIRAVYLRRIGA